MEHVTSDLKLIDRLWNDPTYGLDGFSTEGGYIQPIDRDQAVDGDGHANYDGYVLSREIEDDDSPVSELETYQFDAGTMESYARKWRTMLDLEQLLSDLRDLEHELNSMGVEAVLDERDDGMPEFHFGEFGGGLSWWVNKGFYLTIWAGNLSDVYDTNIFREFRHELMRRLADQYEGKAQDTRDTWGRLCGDDTPMPANLAEKADGYEHVAERLHDAIRDDGVPVFIDNFADFKLLRQHDPRDLLTDVTGQRLRDMGLVERKYRPGDVFDELTDKGRAAVEYTARTMGISLK